jgi:hypothetical protein
VRKKREGLLNPPRDGRGSNDDDDDGDHSV